MCRLASFYLFPENRNTETNREDCFHSARNIVKAYATSPHQPERRAAF
jgi:hypothetical protein